LKVIEALTIVEYRDAFVFVVTCIIIHVPVAIQREKIHGI